MKRIYFLCSLIIAFAAGMLITLLTIFIASRKVSRLNIIRAIRGIPEPRYQRHEISTNGNGNGNASLMTRVTQLKTRIHDILMREYEIVLMAFCAFLVFLGFVDLGISEEQTR